ncbi:MAG: acetyl-CoA carboxylase subunit beta [Candidatus Firestonebacteria bacterium RIFOXYC2_FULL_39_67]|nr:MAG: acetyl-CoA carboxylase subunit beta [Candidatus Firestonebacteria bacterium RIFOXYD2_FULL_39_29]OGF55200.1 MAG: acetyl-CoA carboxylase subunit beta [Candidatus Firestonebacteria bacterium RIFOXYC2_FULL_39_67]
MALFKKMKFRELTAKKVEIPNGLWSKCDNCKEMIYTKQLEENLRVCPKCQNHFRMNAKERIKLLVDEGTWVEDKNRVIPMDPLNFPEYKGKLKKSQEATGLDDAIITGEGKICGIPTAIGVTDSFFMMGSMGSVVGEKLTRIVEHAIARKIPLLLVSSSGGGARMQEGILSLMQMAKTSAALKKLTDAHIPYIALLTDPTGGGVTASWGMLGDITIAEPNALILFAGPRVIEQTIRQKLPKGFQRSEFLQEHGFIDMVVHRKDLKESLSKVLKFFYNN